MFISQAPYSSFHAELDRVKDGLETVLDALASQGNAKIRQEAAQALAQNRDPRTVTSLIAALVDEHASVSENAAASLGKIGDPQAVAPLIALLQHKSATRRRCAAAALGKIGDKSCVAELTELAAEYPEIMTRRAILESVRKLSPGN